MNEYRCTRNALYDNKDTKLRQGHYILAIDKKSAYEEMQRRFPSEVSAGFTVDLWSKENIKTSDFLATVITTTGIVFALIICGLLVLISGGTGN
jgi:hypothetical protein